MTITDNGCGIPESIRPRIFEPFFTTKEVGSGVGLGLAVSFRVLQQHNAQLKILSREGEGTRFTILFEEAQDARSSAGDR